MSKLKHSPLPWKIVANSRKMSAVVSGNGKLVAGSLICEQQEAQRITDHKLIVTAVNHHEELVGALKHCLCYLESDSDDGQEAEDHKIASELLAKIEKGSK